MDWSDFFYGTRRATITPSKILAAPFQRNREQVARVMQGAFDLYYQAHQAAKKITEVLHQRKYSAEAQKKIWDLQSAMQADIRSAADAWHFSDLKSCFQHLAQNGGFWKHDSWNGWRGVCNIPNGISGFLDEVDKRGSLVVSSAAEWNQHQAHMARLKEERRWEDLGGHLSNAEEVIEMAAPKIWVVIGASVEKGEDYSELMKKWVGYAGQLHGALSLYLTIRYADSGAKEQALAEIAAFAVQGLPVFGSLYADLIRDVPKMVNYFKNIAGQRNRYIEALMR